MLDKLIKLVQIQIKEGGQEEAIEACTFDLIDSDDLSKLPEKTQDAIYQLNMYGLNKLTKQDYAELLQDIKD